jgi:hypothetical protein
MRSPRFFFAANARWRAAMPKIFENRPDPNGGRGRGVAVEPSRCSGGGRYEPASRWAGERGPLKEPARGPSSLPLIAAIVAVIFGAMALIGLRETIVRALPGAAALYSAAGLPINIAGLELRGVRSKIVLEGSRQVLTVDGEIVNVRRDANRVPPVALAVRDKHGQTTYSWTTPAPKARLDGGETVAFRARLASPPEGGAEVLVHFAELGPSSRK